MPAQKRSLGSPAHSNEEENSNNSSTQEFQIIESIQSDSDESLALSIGDEDGYITVTLADLRKEVQCAICLGIIRKTRTVMECLHRFCRECIDKSMRLGNNECPSCRTHCASRRSLRDDPNFDTLISVLYPDIDKYEEEELAFYEEERTRFKQVQASIAQTLHRQSEVIAKRRSTGKTTAAARTSDRSSRGRRNQRAVEQQGSDRQDGANGHERLKDSSSADEPVTEVQPKRCKRWTASHFSQTFLGAGNADGDGDYTDINRDSLGASEGLVAHSEMLTWGGGGIRSNTRHCSLSAGNAKNARNMRMSKLFDSFLNTVKVDGMDIHLILVALDEQRIPSLENPHIRCSPTVSVRYLCQYVGSKTNVSADEVEILLVKGLHSIPNLTVNPSIFIPDRSIDPCRDELHILEEHETLAELLALYNVNRPGLLFAYRQKSASVNPV